MISTPKYSSKHLVKATQITFEELFVGQSAEIQRTLNLQDIHDFCELTGDNHPLHTDKTYAIKSGFDDIIAHGLLISSLSSTLIGMHLPGEGTIILSQSFNYQNPVIPGDILTIRGEVSNLDDRFQTLDVKVKINNQRGEIVSKGKYSVKLRAPKI